MKYTTPRSTANQMVRYEISVEQLIMCVSGLVPATGCWLGPRDTMQNRLCYPSRTRQYALRLRMCRCIPASGLDHADQTLLQPCPALIVFAEADCCCAAQCGLCWLRLANIQLPVLHGSGSMKSSCTAPCHTQHSAPADCPHDTLRDAAACAGLQHLTAVKLLERAMSDSNLLHRRGALTRHVTAVIVGSLANPTSGRAAGFLNPCASRR